MIEMVSPFHAYVEKATGRGNVNYLFLCHFLSTWNARSYEFATTLFVAKAFPDGLSFVSWGGITTSLSIICFASTIGRWIDAAPSRLRNLVTSIFINRIVVIIACIAWMILLAQGQRSNIGTREMANAITDDEASETAGFKFGLFVFITLFGVFERLSRVGTLLSVERDWVPNLAILTPDRKLLQAPQDLAWLNAVMSRIDLVCKLISPIVMAYLVSSTESPQFALWTLIGINVITWPLECWTAWKVWSTNQSLQESKQTTTAVSISDHNVHAARSEISHVIRWPLDVTFRAFKWTMAYVESLAQYFSTDVWMPSIAITSLHFSVLSFSGILTVFLIQSGFSSRLIMWGEAISAVFELSSTFVFAWGVRLLSRQVSEYVPLQDREEGSSGDGDVVALEEASSTAVDQSVGSSRLGMWALLQMLAVLIPTVPAIWQFANLGAQNASQDPETPSSAWHSHVILTLLVIIFISASRLGRWTAVLSVQQLAQTCVKSNQRSVFAGTEASFASLFGLGHYVITAVWSRHEDFKWVAVLSLVIVAGSLAMYWIWLVKRSPAARQL